MSTNLASIGTATPPAPLPQSEARDLFAAQPGVDRLTGRLIRAAFDQSAIDTRYSVLGPVDDRSRRFLDGEGRLLSPTTGERNAVYRREAPPLYAEAAASALERSGYAASEVTHVVTASCTGFFAPGPDFLLVKELGLPTTVERQHIGFMGCAAAFPALRAARDIADARPGSIVLVACAELCSLHIRSSRDPEQIVASAVFGDGAGAAIVSSAPPRRDGAVLRVDGFTTTITPEGEEDMDWAIGDQGFEMRLTAAVPRIIGREVDDVVRTLLGADGAPRDTVEAWAVHPGGRSVLDRVQAGLGLPDAAMTTSRDVLRDYGNMSSATILFILQRILADDSLADDSLADDAPVVGLCFGPGLTAEAARFTRQRALGDSRDA